MGTQRGKPKGCLPSSDPVEDRHTLESIFMYFTWQRVPLFTATLKESPLSTYLAMGPCETNFFMSMGHGHTLIQMYWRRGPLKALIKTYTPTQRQIHTEVICGKLGTDTMI